MKAGYQLSYTDRYLTVNVSAGKTALGHLNVADIKGSVNVENLDEGVHLVAISIQLDEEIYYVGDVLTEITLVSPEMDSETNSEEDTEKSDTEKPDDSAVSGETGGNNPETDTENGTERSTEGTETTETTEVQTEGH